MKYFNALMTMLFDLACWPFRALAPIWAMLVISLVAGVLMLWIFGKVSNQDAIHRIRDMIRGNLIGVRLFQHDVFVVFKLQRKILRDTLAYMGHALFPMLILMPPVLLIMFQLNLRFSVRPLEPGETTLIEAHLRDGSALSGPIDLIAPDGVTVETPPVRSVGEAEATWRIRADAPGVHTLIIRSGEHEVEKELVIAERWGPVSAIRTGKSIWDKLLWPGEPPIPSSSIFQSVEINYPELPIYVFGFNINWLILFFVLSIVFGYAFKDLLGVEI